MKYVPKNVLTVVVGLAAISGLFAAFPASASAAIQSADCHTFRDAGGRIIADGALAGTPSLHYRVWAGTGLDRCAVVWDTGNKNWSDLKITRNFQYPSTNGTGYYTDHYLYVEQHSANTIAMKYRAIAGSEHDLVEFSSFTAPKQLSPAGYAQWFSN